MEIYNNNIRVISSSRGDAISGSILKVLCLQAGNLRDVKFGQSNPNTKFSTTSDTIGSITMAQNQELDGPIGEVKAGNAGGFLFYLREY